MCGAIFSLPSTSSWCGAQLKKSTGITLPLPLRLFNFTKYPLDRRLGGWGERRAALDWVEKRKNPFNASSGDLSPIVQAVT
jgi:hypothetical protein